jgi:molybdopterin/thiamine biosynthesis adenylyltransferase
MTAVDLRVPADLFSALRRDVAGREEWAGYLLCGATRGHGRVTLLGRSWNVVPGQQRRRGTTHGFSWSPDFDVEMLNRAQRENLACVVIHYHGGHAPGQSGTDRATCDSLLPFLSQEAPGRPHGFLILGDGAADCAIFYDGAQTGRLDGLRVTGAKLDDWSEPSHPPAPIDPRHDRLVRGFGAAAYHRLRAARVGVVGVGGGGSHIVQQLAYLGVGSIVVIDGDVVDLTNLNRLIGALPPGRGRGPLGRLGFRTCGDVGGLKVDVMVRMVRAIAPEVEVIALPEPFPSERTVAALRECDVIVGCVDRLQVRDDLNRFAKRFLTPMIDIGLEITPNPADGSIIAIPGRVTKVLADGPCLRCQGVIDDRKLELERGGRPLGYTGTTDIPDPAVVTLNGVVASMGATEVLQIVTGFADGAGPNCGWIFDGLTGQVERVEKPYRGCPACDAERGAGDP